MRFYNLYFVSLQVFDTIRQNQPEALDKLVAVAGDVMLPEFGLSPSDLKMLIENVSIVFNSAATVKFDEELKTAVEMNVHGPKRLLELCRQMKQLKVANYDIRDCIVDDVFSYLRLFLERRSRIDSF